MHPRWISSTSTAMLLVFFFNTCLFGVLLAGMLFAHKAHEKNALKVPSEETMELRLSTRLVEHPSTVFHWEHEWEFEYNGEMYDVVSSRTEGDITIFTCKHDGREEILMEDAEREAEDQQDDRTTQNKKNLKVGSDYFSVATAWKSMSSANLSLHPEVTCNLYAVLQQIPDPPPWAGAPTLS